MRDLYSILLQLVFSFATVREVMLIECPDTTRPNLRSFPSLKSYQGNKIPFDPRNSSLGNYVSFGFKQIDNLPKNTFITFDSEHIIRLDLDGKSIQRIDDGAFLSLSCLKYLSLKNNSIKILTWKSFNGLTNLNSLELGGNKMRQLPAMAFATLHRLNYLDLSNNLLQKISPFTFENMTNLRTLILKKNDLAYIDSDVFFPLTDLESLDLSFNKLTDVDSSQKWILPKLQMLNLAGNYLASFDTSLNYTYNHLRKLNLSYNHLSDINSFKLVENFYNLTVLDLNQNYWYCDNLAKILHYIADSKIRVPSRNHTNINELGIDCENDIVQHTDEIPETTVTISTSTTTSKAQVNEIKIGNEIQKLSVKHDEILLEISGVRKLLIFSLLFFVVFVVLYASVQIGLCDVLKIKRSRREGYIDTSIQDNYSMLRP